MNIVDATKKAIEIGGVIERKGAFWCAVPYANSPMGVDVLFDDGSLKEDGGWYEFSALDLVADDWEAFEIGKSRNSQPQEATK